MLYGTEFKYYNDSANNKNKNVYNDADYNNHNNNHNNRNGKRTVSSMKKGLSTVYNVHYGEKEEQRHQTINNNKKDKNKQKGKYKNDNREKNITTLG